MKNICTSFVLVIAILLTDNFIIAAQVNVNDSLALIDLYNNTDGPHWFLSTNWLTAKPVTTWYGVYIKDANRVYSIFLHDNNLNGSIPASIGNITEIVYLGLYNNQLTGSIPLSIGNLKKLEHIDLSHNQLTGTIPSRLGKLHRLTILNLYHNKLQGQIPSSLATDTLLQLIYLHHNHLKGVIPPLLGNLHRLSELILSNNNIGGSIPPTLGKLKNLFHCDLDHNNLSGSIPSELGNLNLDRLDLNNNQLTGNIPSSLSTITDISQINLSDNQLTGTIPTSFGSFKEIWNLYLSNNKLSGKIPASFSNLLTLKKLYLQNNRLTDTVPSFLASLPNLHELGVSNNYFTFNGLETIAQHSYRILQYAPQGNIEIHQKNNKLSVYAGGTLSNNTYKWFKNGILISTKNGDSTFTSIANGNYNVEVTNSFATELTLYSDTINITSLAGLQQNNISSVQLNNNSFNVYPNPAKTSAAVTFNTIGNYTIKLLDASGNILQTQTGTALKGINTIQLNINKYAIGVYFIILTNGLNQKQTLKLNKE